MKHVLLILSPGFEELEAVAPLDLLRRAGIEVTAAAAGDDLLVEGGRRIRIRADRRLDECLDAAYDLVILPGGPGVKDLRRVKGFGYKTVTRLEPLLAVSGATTLGAAAPTPAPVPPAGKRFQAR